MSRSYRSYVLCLRVKPSGESNREAWFLSAEEGVFKATVSGGPKSRLRSQVSPFHQGTLWVYHDPVRDSRKVTDFDVEAWRPGLRELYERALAADALAETVLATHGGGGAWGAALELAGKTLDCLETGDEKNCGCILLHFFWAWTEFLGLRPDLARCTSCACEIPPDKVLWYVPSGHAGDEGYYGSRRSFGSTAAFLYDQREGGVYCGKCRGESDLPLEAGTRRWLLTAGALEPHDALYCGLEAPSFRQARAFVLGILAAAVGRRLPLWDEL